MHVPYYIAKRYLFAKKSHNVINIISAISAVGMAIGTAALIIILSIYNGFDEIVKSMLSNIEPELIITPSKGKVFTPEGDTYDWLYDQKSVKTICTTLEENVFLNYDGAQSTALAKGVDKIYEEESPLRKHMKEGDFLLHRGDIPLASVGAGLAYKLGIRTHFLSPLEVYYPSRKKNISLINPAASLRSVKVYPESIFTVNVDIDQELFILPIEHMRELLEYKNEVSSVEIRLWEEFNTQNEVKRIQSELESRLGKEFKVKDRFQQNESLYKMMKYEKVSIFMILIFVIIIVAFNIFGSLTMLIIDKKTDIETFKSMGAELKTIKRIFILEGWLISILGMLGGLIIGIGFCLAQEHFGFIKMPGSFAIQAYPIILSIKDILMTIIGVATIGYLIAIIPSKKIKIK